LPKNVEAEEFQRGAGEGLEERSVKDYQQANHTRSKESSKPEINGSREHLAEGYALHTCIFLWHLFIRALGGSRLIEPLV